MKPPPPVTSTVSLAGDIGWRPYTLSGRLRIVRNDEQMLRSMRILLGLGAAVFLLVAAPLASAVPSTAPPGVSELDQYSETVLGAGGENTIDPSRGGGEGVLSPSTERQLQQLGPDGQAAARLAQATAPRGDPPAGGGDGESGSAFGALTDAVTGAGDDGLGILLPLILAAVAAAGLLFVLLRRRAGHAG
jgi:hypothetical protein